MYTIARTSVLVAVGLQTTLAACSDNDATGVDATCNADDNCVNTADATCVDVVPCPAGQTETAGKTASQSVGLQRECETCEDLTDAKECYANVACVSTSNGCETIATCTASQFETAAVDQGGNGASDGTNTVCGTCEDLADAKECFANVACVSTSNGCETIATCTAPQFETAAVGQGSNGASDGTNTVCETCADLTDAECVADNLNNCVRAVTGCVELALCGGDSFQKTAPALSGGIEYGVQPTCESAGASISPFNWLAGTMAAFAFIQL